jgi:hypothetical protein
MGGECSLKRVQIDVSLGAPSLFALGALAASAGLSCLSCRARASPEDCREAIEHYLDLAVAESPGGRKMSPAEAAAVRDVERGLKRAEPSYRRVQDRCDSAARAEIACASRAETTAAWEACLRPRDGG